MDNIKEEIKKILAPHFGYLPLFMKWYDEVGLKKLKEFHKYMDNNPSIIKALPQPLMKYDSYYEYLIDVITVEKTIKIRQKFRDGLNGKSRKFFDKTFKELFTKYEELFNNDIKLSMFFRTSSKPQSLPEYVKYVQKIIDFDDKLGKLIDQIEQKFDYLRTENGGYLIELKKPMLHIVPSTWCIHKNDSMFNSEKDGRNLNSIWLVIDPYNIDANRRMVGIDVTKDDFNNILYMDSLNNRFIDNPPITSKEFFKLTSHRLEDVSEIKFNAEDFDVMSDLLKEYQEEIIKVHEELEQHEKENEESDSTLKRLLNGDLNEGIDRIFGGG